MKYILSGDPIPLKRPRLRKNVGLYDPQVSEKKRAQLELKIQHGSRPFLSGPLELIITFFMKIPDSKKRTVRPYLYHPVKPDLSNLIKFVEDIATGILYEDDNIIASIQAVKYYALVPRTELILVPLVQKETHAKETGK